VITDSVVAARSVLSVAPELTEWLVPLVAERSRPRPVPFLAPHAVVSGWLGHDQQPKPYALAPPELDAHGVLLLVVRLLDPRLVDVLAHAAVPGGRVRLGAQTYRIAGDPVLRRADAIAELGGSKRQVFELRTQSPMTFRRRGRTSPLPAPDSIITSLRERWAALLSTDPPAQPRAGSGEAYVRDVEGRSDVIDLKGTVVSAFTGRVVLAAEEPSAAAGLDRLLGFASYAGVGSHTARGLGGVAVRALSR